MNNVKTTKFCNSMRPIVRAVALVGIAVCPLTGMLASTGCASHKHVHTADRHHFSQYAARQARLKAAEEQFTCFYLYEESYRSMADPGAAKEGVALTAEEMDILAALYATLVPDVLVWSLAPIGAEMDTIIVRLATSSDGNIPASDEFLNRVSTEKLRAIASGKASRDLLGCTLQLRSWISADSAVVRASVGNGDSGTFRRALAVRDGNAWRICPSRNAILVQP